MEWIDVSIRSTMRCLWVNNGEDTLEDLGDRAPSILKLTGGVKNIQGGRWMEQGHPKQHGNHSREKSHASSWQQTTGTQRSRRARTAFRYHGRGNIWWSKLLQPFQIMHMSRTTSFWITSFIVELATAASIATRSAAISRRIPTSSRLVTGTVRPFLGWVENTVNWRRTQRFTTFNPRPDRWGLCNTLNRASVVSDTIHDMRQVVIQGLTVRIQTPQPAVWLTLRCGQVLCPLPPAPSHKTMDTGCRVSGLWIH